MVLNYTFNWRSSSAVRRAIDTETWRFLRFTEARVRVLVVEDHAGLARNVARALRESAGYAVDMAFDGEDGLFLAETNPYDLILLDLMLPKLDGLGVLRSVRRKSIQTPVLILTSRDDKETTVALLDAGADDYLTKPFDVGEMVARCRALIRRAHGIASPVIEIDDLAIHPDEMTVTRAGRPVSLTAMEYRLLEYMAHRPRAVLSKSELLEHLYDHDWEKFSNVIEVYVSSLRRKLNPRATLRLSTPSRAAATSCCNNPAFVTIPSQFGALAAAYNGHSSLLIHADSHSNPAFDQLLCHLLGGRCSDMLRSILHGPAQLVPGSGPRTR